MVVFNGIWLLSEETLPPKDNLVEKLLKTKYGNCTRLVLEFYASYIDNLEVEQDSSFKYLDIIPNQDLVSEKKVRSRIKQTTAAFIKMKNQFT